MSAATDNRQYTGTGTNQTRGEMLLSQKGPVADNVQLFVGTLGGYLLSDTDNPPALQPFVSGGTMRCTGFVTRGANNLTSGGIGETECNVVAQTGTLIDLNAGGGSAITMADRFKPAYGVDDQTVSKLPGDGDLIGMIAGIDIASGLPVVCADPVLAKIMATIASGVTFTQTYSTASATIAAVTSHTITDSSGGTPSTSALAAQGVAVTAAAPATPGGATPSAGNVDTGINTALAQLLTELNAQLVIIRNNIATTNAELTLVKADLLAAKQNDNKVVDVLQAIGAAL